MALFPPPATPVSRTISAVFDSTEFIHFQIYSRSAIRVGPKQTRDGSQDAPSAYGRVFRATLGTAWKKDEFNVYEMDDMRYLVMYN